MASGHLFSLWFFPAAAWQAPLENHAVAFAGQGAATCFVVAASVTEFICARPCSNWPPTILSQFMNRPTALERKLFLPYMLQVTAVWLPSGLKVNSAVLLALKGFKKSSLNRTNTFGRLSMTVMRPSPILLLPDHANAAPTPAAGPS